MTFDDFVKRIQQQAGLKSSEEARQAVNATLETLRACLAEGGAESLPAEVREMVGAGLVAGGVPGQPQVASANPQIAGQDRVESGGESTASSGQ
jgi:uncharacterized protein (DUF2267 family)